MGGGWNRGLSSARSKLTYQQVQEIRRECAHDGANLAAIAREYKVSRRTIRDIRERELYRWVPDQGKPGDDIRERALDSQIQIW